MQSRMGKRIKAVLIVAFWLALWQGFTFFLNNSILLSGPLEVFAYLKDHILTVSFWKTVGNSFFHIFSGFFSAFVIGVFLGIFSAKYSFLEDLLSPFLQLVKAVPVASFVVLLLIWAGSKRLSVSVTFLMALPILYQNVLEGIKNTDTGLLEMAQVYQLSLWNKIFFIYRPALMPFLMSSSKVALGMSFKAGVAAEVIGTPDFSIGERIYMSKIYLDTAGLFSWTFVVIVLSFFFEKFFLGLLVFAGRKRIKAHPKKSPSEKRKAVGTYKRNGQGTCREQKDIAIMDLAKYYEEKEIFVHLTKTFWRGGVYAVMGESGCGKTTLFRILLGLTDYNTGELALPGGRCGAVFQEDRLCLRETPVVNVSMAADGRRGEKEIEKLLLEILPGECLQQETEQLSGGMRRRTAIARALLSDSEWLLLDEPFTGLDEETKKRTIAFIMKYRNGRTLLMTTHHKEEAEMMAAELVPFRALADG